MKTLTFLTFFTIIFSCTHKSPEYKEKIIINQEEGFKYISKSYQENELDTIWKYHLDGHLISVYTGDSLGRCFGWTSGYRKSGELHYIGKCNYSMPIGKWHFYNKLGELDFLNFYSNGSLYQRWFLNSGDTTKMLYPIIDIEPRAAAVFDTIHVRVDYILEGIDTTDWDYYLHFDFIEREKYESQSSLPYEEYVERYEGEQIKRRFEFLVPGDIVMYGYTLAINRETGDSIYHLEILEQYLTILDSTSVEM